MKHFLRLLFVGAVLFVLLGLFRHTQDQAPSGDLAKAGVEQVLNQSGILSHQQEIPSPGSFSPDSFTPDQAKNDFRYLREKVFSKQSMIRLEQSNYIFGEIKYELLQRTGRHLLLSSRKEILS